MVSLNMITNLWNCFLLWSNNYLHPNRGPSYIIKKNININKRSGFGFYKFFTEVCMCLFFPSYYWMLCKIWINNFPFFLMVFQKCAIVAYIFLCGLTTVHFKISIVDKILYRDDLVCFYILFHTTYLYIFRIKDDWMSLLT